MKKITVFIMEYIYPGLLVANVDRHYVESATTKINWTDRVTCVRRFERVDIIDGQETFHGKEVITSKLIYHPKSRILSYQEVLNAFPDKKTLLSNMKLNNYSHIIRAPNGVFNSYDPKECTVG